MKNITTLTSGLKSLTSMHNNSLSNEIHNNNAIKRENISTS